MQQLMIYIIICEGASEYAYIQEFNRYLREKGIRVSLVPKNAGSGHFKKVIALYKQQKPQNKNVHIWVDKDIYMRNNNNNNDNYQQRNKSMIPDFMFNTFNFEDFLTLHLEKHEILKWQSICESKNHFKTPLHAENHYILYTKNIFPHYKKGELPFDINKTSLNQLIKNNKDNDIKFKSDFAVFLESVLK